MKVATMANTSTRNAVTPQTIKDTAETDVTGLPREDVRLHSRQSGWSGLKHAAFCAIRNLGAIESAAGV